MRYNAKLVSAFSVGLVAGVIVSAAVVSWKWSRDYDDLRAVMVAGQAHTASEIYAGHSDELAERILRDIPGYLADIERSHSRPRSTPLVANWVHRAYEGSGQIMPDSAKEILDRWAGAPN